jgi:hypothetical protein
MRSLFIVLATFFLLSKAFADTPTPTPTPTATPYSALPETTTATVTVGSWPIMVLPKDSSRVSGTILSASGSDVTCSHTDSNVKSDVFRLTTSSRALPIASSPLYCVSLVGAQLNITTTQSVTRSYSNVFTNVGTSGLQILPDNSDRTRALIQVTSGTAYCGYECPAGTSNGVKMTTTSAILELRSSGAICCATSSGLADVVVVSEVGKK